MSFHEDSFHETKRERKYFEDKKQTALKAIDDIRFRFQDLIIVKGIGGNNRLQFQRAMLDLRKRVNDI